MSRFVTPETDAIDLGDGDVVHIRRRMNYGQQRALASLMTGKDQALATSEYLSAVLQQNIVRWEGPGFKTESGEVAEVNRETIDALEPAIAGHLTNEIAARNGADSSFTKTATASSAP